MRPCTAGVRLIACKLGSYIGWNPYETAAAAANQLRAAHALVSGPARPGPARAAPPGSRDEAAALALYQRLLSSGSAIAPGQLLSQEMYPGVFLSGVPDGIVDDCVVEVKCRQKRLLPTPPLQDVAQVYAYMHLTGLRQAVLVQHFNGSLVVDHVPWKPEVWACIDQRLAEFLWTYQLARPWPGFVAPK